MDHFGDYKIKIKKKIHFIKIAITNDCNSMTASFPSLSSWLMILIPFPSFLFFFFSFSFFSLPFLLLFFSFDVDTCTGRNKWRSSIAHFLGSSGASENLGESDNLGTSENFGTFENLGASGTSVPALADAPLVLEGLWVGHVHLVKAMYGLPLGPLCSKAAIPPPASIENGVDALDSLLAELSEGEPSLDK